MSEGAINLWGNHFTTKSQSAADLRSVLLISETHPVDPGGRFIHAHSSIHNVCLLIMDEI